MAKTDTQIIDQVKAQPKQETALATARTMTPGQLATLLSAKDGVDVDKLARLMELQERHEANDERHAFAQALVLFRSKCKPIIQTGHRDDRKTKKRDGTFGTVKYDYAELSSTLEQILPLLEQCSIMPTWRMVKNDPNWVEIECILTHILGYSQSSMPLGSPPLDGLGMNPVQKRTGAITMLKRATLFMALGLVTKDDDADLYNAEQGEEEQKPQSQVAIEDDENDIKRQFMATCREKSHSPNMTSAAVKLAFAAVQRACGSMKATDCLLFVQRNVVAVGANGSIAVATPSSSSSTGEIVSEPTIPWNE